MSSFIEGLKAAAMLVAAVVGCGVLTLLGLLAAKLVDKFQPTKLWQKIRKMFGVFMEKVKREIVFTVISVIGIGKKLISKVKAVVRSIPWRKVLVSLPILGTVIGFFCMLKSGHYSFAGLAFGGAVLGTFLVPVVLKLANEKDLLKKLYLSVMTMCGGVWFMLFLVVLVSS